MGSTLNSVRSVAGTEFRRMQIRDERTSGGTPPQLPASVWNTRELNTVKVNEIPGSSLSTNQITLPAGSYRIRAACMQYRGANGKTRLYDTTGTVTLVDGFTVYCDSANFSTEAMPLEGEFTLSQTSVLELQHWLNSSTGGNAGTATAGPGEQEVFVDIVIEQEVDATNIRAIETGKLLHLQHQEPDGTVGGATVAETWAIRPLNTVIVNEIDGASVASNRFTLPVGTYYVHAKMAIRYSDYNMMRIYNFTDSAQVLRGVNLYAGSSGGTFDPQFLNEVDGKITVSGSAKEFQLEHWARQTQSNGFGFANNGTFSGVEIYADLKIWKVGE
jgi:hypothetical protein